MTTPVPAAAVVAPVASATSTSTSTSSSTHDADFSTRTTTTTTPAVAVAAVAAARMSSSSQQFAVGDLVFVDRRAWPGMKLQPGGVAKVISMAAAVVCGAAVDNSGGSRTSTATAAAPVVSVGIVFFIYICQVFSLLQSYWKRL
jgi:hypothetical protein